MLGHNFWEKYFRGAKMCYFITATLPQDTNLTKLKTIIKQYEMGFAPLINSSVIQQLPAGNLYFTATKAHCDCDTVLGCELQTESQDVSDNSDIKRLRKKGWSQSKIDRWLTEKEQSREAEKLEQKQKNKAEAQRWLGFIKDMLILGKVSHIGILKHLYGGDIEKEKFIICDTVNIGISQTTIDYLFTLKEDTLYMFLR